MMQAPQAVRPVHQAQFQAGRQNVGTPFAGRPSWHSPDDLMHRREVTRQIMHCLAKRKPGVTKEWTEKLPDFVKRLEDALYNAALSREEYADLTTLEARLTDVAKKMVNKPQAPQMQAPQFAAAAGVRPVNNVQNGMNGMIGSSMMPHQQMQHTQQASMSMGVGQTSQMMQVQQPGFSNPAYTQSNGLVNNVYTSNGMSMVPQPVGFPQQLANSNMMPTSAFAPQQSLSTPLLPNGQPILRTKAAGRDWAGQASSLIPTAGGPGGKVGMNGHAPGVMPTPNMQPSMPVQQTPGFIPTNPMPNMIPINQQPSPMVPVQQMKTPQQPMLPSGPAGPGMVPVNGMIPVSGSYGASPSAFANSVPNSLHPMHTMPMLQQPQQQQQQQQQISMPQAQPQHSAQHQMSQQLQMQSSMLSGPQSSVGLSIGSGQPGEEQSRVVYVQKQQRWLLFLRHCAKCQLDEKDCQYKRNCKIGKDLWKHILNCSDPKCTYPRCVGSRDLLKHHQKCQSLQCPICTPVKEYVKRTKMQGTGRTASESNSMGSIIEGPALHPTSSTSMNGSASSLPVPSAAPTVPHTVPQPIPEPQPTVTQVPPAQAMNMVPQQPPPVPQMPQPQPQPQVQMVPQPQPPQQQQQQQQQQALQSSRAAAAAAIPANSAASVARIAPKREPEPEEPNSETQAAKRQKQITSANMGSSLLETFTEQQIQRHVELIREAAAPALKSEVSKPEDCCTVCQLSQLAYEPPAILCNVCGIKIKRGSTYYCTAPDVEPKNCWCHSCHGNLPTEISSGIRKADLQKRKNDEEMHEGWVACDNCEGWVHQVCGLFNKGRNSGDVHFLCPTCLSKGLRDKKRVRVVDRPQSMLEGKDLPTCELSNYLEGKLNAALHRERTERASKVKAAAPKDVPTAEGLTIRVINSVVKKCEIKNRFYDTFRDEGYPGELPYRQKVVVLFQNLDGVDVCIFCMYVQEYGADCPAPNRNCVYLSYLDSVKYFQPEDVRCMYGHALRTFVYHEILIAYLEYVKMLGFEQMYIWACPPMQGDDYIMYCHPARQKTPQGGRLRRWYLDMLRRAEERGIISYITNLFDTYFDGGRDHRFDRCSATHIPYLEGDYWPGEAEMVLSNIQEIQKAAAAKNNKATAGGRSKHGAKGKRYGTGPMTADETLMCKLGEVLSGAMKEDFIVAHMQEPCLMCRKHVLGGEVLYRWRADPKESGSSAPVKNAVKQYEGIVLGPNNPPATRYQICSSCHQQEEARISGGECSRLPQGLALSAMQPVKLEPQHVMRDPDPDIENEFFDTRQNFLNLCQGNHYQFDTLRRAKHSSMMMLYHLHNPSAPAFASTCNICNGEIEPGQGFRCTVCQDFDMCKTCHEAGRTHEHPLVSHAQDDTRHMSAKAREKERIGQRQQMHRTMKLLVHACSCNSTACQSNSCRKVRQLFQHTVACKLKVTGGCAHCKKMWYLLNLHAKWCMKADCNVPRCRELKDLRRRQTARQEDQRRAAYRDMFRNQAVASSQTSEKTTEKMAGQ